MFDSIDVSEDRATSERLHALEDCSELETLPASENPDAPELFALCERLPDPEDLEVDDTVEVVDGMDECGILGNLEEVDVPDPDVFGSGGGSGNLELAGLAVSDSSAASDKIAASDSLTMRCRTAL